MPSKIINFASNSSKFGIQVTATLVNLYDKFPILYSRIKIIKHFIKVAGHCFKETRNFNSMFAITSGLHNADVQRLKQTWDKIPDKYKLKLQEMVVRTNKW